MNVHVFCRFHLSVERKLVLKKLDLKNVEFRVKYISLNKTSQYFRRHVAKIVIIAKTTFYKL